MYISITSSHSPKETLNLRHRFKRVFKLVVEVDKAEQSLHSLNREKHRL
jgi:hypothetical protein